MDLPNARQNDEPAVYAPASTEASSKDDCLKQRQHEAMEALAELPGDDLTSIQGKMEKRRPTSHKFFGATTHVRRNYAVSRDCYTAHLSEDQKRAIVESHARIVAHGYCDCIKLLVGRAKPLSRLIEEGGHGYCDCIKLLVGAAASPIACARGSQRSQRSAVECLCKFRAQPRVGCGRIAASMRRCVAWQSPRGGSEGVILARLMGAHLMGWFHKAHVRTDSVEPEALRLGIHREPDWWAGRGSAAQLQQVRRGYLLRQLLQEIWQAAGQGNKADHSKQPKRPRTKVCQRSQNWRRAFVGSREQAFNASP